MVKNKSITRKVNTTIKPKSQLSIKSVVAGLSRETLERKFKEHKMSKKQSIGFLMKTMGISAISYSKGYPSIVERYNAIVGTYLSGVWKRGYSSWNQGES
jgi:hypothetical protein